MDSLAEKILNKRLERERLIRQEAERLLEEKSYELYQAKLGLESKLQEMETLAATLQKTKEELTLALEQFKAADDQKSKAYRQLEELKDSLEKQTGELQEEKGILLESIRYAFRLQQSMLANEEDMAKWLDDMMLLFKPRDIVSGDFYWYREVWNPDDTARPSHLVIAALDCTGHGIPGAFMSLIANELLNQAVIWEKLTSPEKILQHLFDELPKKFDQTDYYLRDGMDISITTIDFTQGEVIFSGAKMPLVYFQHTDGKLDMGYVKGDNLFIESKVSNDTDQKFQKHTFKVRGEMSFYLFSDGFQDQFGGKDGKKFMSKRLRETLQAVNHLNMTAQRTHLNDTLSAWKKGYGQVDDIMIIGFKVSEQMFDTV